MEQLSPPGNGAGTDEAEASGEHAREKRAAEEQAAEEQAPEEQVVEESTAEAEAVEEQAAEVEGAKVEVSEERAADVEAAEEQPAEEQAPEEQVVEEQAAEVEAAEEQPAEEQAAEEQGVEEQADEPQAPPKLAFPDMDWYIIHTYSGFENKVKESLRTRADAFGFGDRIGEILIPTEDVVEMRSGKKVRTKRLLYPGYVLVQLQMDDELWHVVRNTPRVTSFVGSGQTPTPLTADEVNQILYRQTASVEKPRPRMTFEKNDRVKIVDGPFSNFAGTVEEVNEDRNTLKVMVTIFGRGTPVELEYFQVEKEKV
jgi:transcriptional antiterminator NusG